MTENKDINPILSFQWLQNIVQLDKTTIEMLCRSEFSALGSLHKLDPALRKFVVVYFQHAREYATLEDQLDDIQAEIADLQQQYMQAMEIEDSERRLDVSKPIFDRIGDLDRQSDKICEQTLRPLEKLQQHVRAQIDAIIKHLAEAGGV